MAKDNPLYPGEYPGAPIQRRPTGGGIIKPFDVTSQDFSGIENMIDDIDDTLDASKIPGWFTERLKDNFTGRLKASVSPKGASPISTSTQEQYGDSGDEMVEDAPGVTAQVELTTDWLLDPVGQTTKTLKSWASGVVDWDDYDGHFRNKVWKRVLSDVPETASTDTWAAKAEEAVATQIAGSSGRTATGRNPLSLDKTQYGNKTIKGAYNADVEVSAYYDTKSSILTLQRQLSNRGKREGFFDDVIDSVTNDSLRNFEAQFASYLPGRIQLGSTEYREALDAFLRDKGINNPALIKTYSDKLIDFKVKSNLSSHLSIVDKKMNALTESLDAYMFTSGSTGADGIEKALGELTDVMNKSGLLGSGNNYIEKQLALLSDSERKRIGGYLKTYQDGAVKDIQGLLKRSDARLFSDASRVRGGIFNRTDAMSLRNASNSIKNGGLLGAGIDGGDMIRNSTRRNILRTISDDIILDADFQDMLSNFTEKGAVINTIMPILDEFVSQYRFEEILQNLEKGKLNIYIWQRIAAKIVSYTPAHWTEYALKKLHYFGLIIDEDSMAKSGILPRMILGRRNTFGVKFMSKGRKISAKILGGQHMSFIETITALVGSGQLDKVEFQVIMNLAHDAETLRRYLMGSNSPLAEALKLDPQALETFIAQAGAFKKWVTDNARKFGLRKGQVDGEFLSNLIESLHNRNLDLHKLGLVKMAGLTRKYQGYLEKVATSLNFLQHNIIKRFGRYIAPVSHLKTYLVSKVMSAKALKLLVAKIASKIVAMLGNAIPGIGTVVAFVLEPLIRYGITKIVNLGEASFKALVKGDFGKLFSDWNESIDKMRSFALKALMIPAFMVFISFFLFSQIISAFSPSDPVAIGGGEYIGPPIKAGGGTTTPCKQETLPDDQISSCFFKDKGFVYWGSHDPTGEDLASKSGGNGHGSNAYWDAMVNGVGIGLCTFIIPGGRTGNFEAQYSIYPQNVCNDGVNKHPGEGKPHYGWAMDIFTNQIDEETNNECGTIYLPTLHGQKVTWSPVTSPVSLTFGHSFATSATVNVNGQEITYKMGLTHAGRTGIRTGATLQSGDAVAELYDWGDNTHLHVELARSTGGPFEIVKPEQFLCN